MEARAKREVKLLLSLAVCCYLLSAIAPSDRLTWFLETLWVPPVLLWVWWSAAKSPLTPLTYRLLFVHACILIIGGYYTYERVPLGEWMQELFALKRNHYDRVGHFAQGFVPAMLVRELLVRHSALVPGKLLALLVTCCALAFSAFFELLEWWAALVLGAGADAFLATQGDPWDTQWDMFLALAGAATAQLLLSKAQDRQLQALAMRRISGFSIGA